MELKEGEYVVYESPNRHFILTNHSLIFNNETWGERNRLIFSRTELEGIYMSKFRSFHILALMFAFFSLGSLLNVLTENAVYAITALLADLIGLVFYLWKRNRDIKFIFKDHILLTGTGAIGISVNKLKDLINDAEN